MDFADTKKWNSSSSSGRQMRKVHVEKFTIIIIKWRDRKTNTHAPHENQPQKRRETPNDNKNGNENMRDQIQKVAFYVEAQNKWLFQWKGKKIDHVIACERATVKGQSRKKNQPERKRQKLNTHTHGIINGYIAQNAALLIINEFSVRFPTYKRSSMHTSRWTHIFIISPMRYSFTAILCEWRIFRSRENNVTKTGRDRRRSEKNHRVKSARANAQYEKEFNKKNERPAHKKNDILRGKRDIFYAKGHMKCLHRFLCSLSLSVDVCVFVVDKNIFLFCTIFNKTCVWWMLVFCYCGFCHWIYQANSKCSWITHDDNTLKKTRTIFDMFFDKQTRRMKREWDKKKMEQKFSLKMLKKQSHSLNIDWPFVSGSCENSKAFPNSTHMKYSCWTWFNFKRIHAWFLWTGPSWLIDIHWTFFHWHTYFVFPK